MLKNILLLTLVALTLNAKETCYSIELDRMKKSDINKKYLTEQTYEDGCSLLNLKSYYSVRCGCHKTKKELKTHFLKLKKDYPKLKAKRTYISTFDTPIYIYKKDIEKIHIDNNIEVVISQKKDSNQTLSKSKTDTIKPIITTQDIQTTTEIEHEELDYIEPSKRFALEAEFFDDSGIERARVYFRKDSLVDYSFVDMDCEYEEDSALCTAVLPSPSTDTKEIQYLLLVENRNHTITQSQLFTTPILKDIPAWKSAQHLVDMGSKVKNALLSSKKVLTVYSEVSKVTQSIPGFTDKIIVETIGLKDKLGVVTGLTSGSSAGVTSSAVSSASGATSAGTTAATSAVSTTTIVAASAGAVVVGGSIATKEESSSTVYDGLILIIFNNAPAPATKHYGQSDSDFFANGKDPEGPCRELSEALNHEGIKNKTKYYSNESLTCSSSLAKNHHYCSDDDDNDDNYDQRGRNYFSDSDYGYDSDTPYSRDDEIGTCVIEYSLDDRQQAIENSKEKY